ncbi:hypothetical protein LY78DRAFT_636517 [Colletotrichum sublineola]|nr:hypothetical protein LY78DRAFT_636517 [Colletotrichum sublineola]
MVTMNFVDHFDGCSFIYEDDRTAIANEYAAAEEKSLPTRQLPRKDGGAPPSLDQHENIRAWLSGVVVDEENKPLVADVLHALSNLPPQGHGLPSTDRPQHQQQQQQQQEEEEARTNVKVHTVGPGFMGRAPPFGSSEFLANMVLVAILLLFAPGFTILAAGVFVTSRVAERWAGQDQ